ncbi:hypothetical protein KIW84_055845 [Lathyrus oleraceus]|uniref:Uncharacterized protein n=1 Tax=Pisum sativum TaxID=3888 RepID=A0A9D4WWN8_PEA|nr:hypothetical protein KIW84_055845 [Pisum sativum]
MNVDDVMSDIQSKLDSQSASMSDLLQSSLDSHSDVIRNTLHQHLLVVDSKVAHLRVDGHSSVDASSGIINRSFRVASWFQWAMRNSLLPSWSVSLSVVSNRFGPTKYEDVEDDLSKLTQSSTMAEF